MVWSDGLRRSPSMSSTLPSDCARQIARFAATNDLPSLGSPLAIKIERSGCESLYWYRRDRMRRNSSASPDTLESAGRVLTSGFHLVVRAEVTECAASATGWYV